MPDQPDFLADTPQGDLIGRDAGDVVRWRSLTSEQLAHSTGTVRPFIGRRFGVIRGAL